jgi:hypothetical protein
LVLECFLVLDDFNSDHFLGELTLTFDDLAKSTFTHQIVYFVFLALGCHDKVRDSQDVVRVDVVKAVVQKALGGIGQVSFRVHYYRLIVVF